MSTCWY